MVENNKVITSKTSSIKISAVIITKNEEKNIARCIDSLQNVADEIVVTDSYSTDKTEEICRKKGVRFIQHPFQGHIQQKNYAITQANHLYVLSLDADEALDENLKKSILEIKENGSFDGYKMNRLTNYCGKWIWYGNWYPDTKLRLWNKTKGKWGGMNPHDKFMMTKEAKITKLKGNILHYSFYSIDEHILQMNKFSGISAQSYYERGRRANFFYILLSPLLSFVKSFVIKKGFMNGYYGLVIAMIDAHFTFVKYIKLKELQKKAKGK